MAGITSATRILASEAPSLAACKASDMASAAVFKGSVVLGSAVIVASDILGPSSSKHLFPAESRPMPRCRYPLGERSRLESRLRSTEAGINY